MQIVPAHREFADQHSARRAKFLAAATETEKQRMKAERATRDAIRIAQQQAARKAAEAKRNVLDLAIERAMAAHQTAPAIELGALGRHQPPSKDVIRLIAQANGITYGDACSARRMKFLVRPRQTAMFIVWSLTNRSLPQIGVMFGGRDHTTILHGVRKMSAEFGFQYPQDRLKAYDKAKEILIDAGYVWPAEIDNAGRGY